jgi:hypothetical protein
MKQYEINIFQESPDLFTVWIEIDGRSSLLVGRYRFYIEAENAKDNLTKILKELSNEG